MPATEQHRFLADSYSFSGSLFGFGRKAKVTVSDSRNILLMVNQRLPVFFGPIFMMVCVYIAM
jgi:hypothetical protein